MSSIWIQTMVHRYNRQKLPVVEQAYDKSSVVEK